MTHGDSPGAHAGRRPRPNLYSSSCIWVSTECSIASISSTTPFWLDTSERPAPELLLRGHEHADLVIVGGGFTGLWTAR